MEGAEGEGRSVREGGSSGGGGGIAGRFGGIGGGGGEGEPSKMQQGGKKFGKKLGNAGRPRLSCSCLLSRPVRITCADYVDSCLWR